MDLGGLFTYTHKPTCWVYTNQQANKRLKTHNTNDKYSRIRLITERVLHNQASEAGAPPISMGAGSHIYNQWPSIFFGD